jgi:hypothetical protein
MATHSSRTKLALIPFGASLTVLAFAAAAYAVTGSRHTADRPAVDAAATRPSPTALTTPTPKPSPPLQPSTSKTTTTPSPAASPYL